MKILVIAGLSDNKLKSKLKPLIACEDVKSLLLVRRNPLDMDTITNISAPQLLRGSRVLSEVFKWCAGFWVALTQRPDVIIGIHFRPHCFLANFLSTIFSRPLVVSFTGNPDQYKEQNRFHRLIHKAQAIVVRGTRSRDYLISEGVDSNKIFIPHNLHSFSTPFNYADIHKTFDIIFIGDWLPEKRVDIFLEVMKKLKVQRPNIKAVMLGAGQDNAKFQSLIHEYDLSKNIVLSGYSKHVNSHIKESKVLLLTSETEGLPMAVIEALGLGVPCVVSDVGDITDVVKDGENSFVVPPLDVDAFVKRAEQLLSDQELYGAMAESALRIRGERRNDYSIEKNMGIWQKILKGLK